MRWLLYFLLIAVFLSLAIPEVVGSGPDEDEIFEEFVETLESVIDQQDDANAAWEQSLAQIQQLTSRANEILEIYVHTETLQHQVDAGIRKFNRDSIQEHVVNSILTLTSEVETLLQVMEAAEEATAEAYMQNETYFSEMEGLVTVSELKKLMDLGPLLATADAAMEANVRATLADSLGSIPLKLPEKMDISFDDVTIPEAPAYEEPVATCPTLEETVKEVQQALLRHQVDGIGMTDHLQAPGTRIVHEMTSDTYWRPTEESDLVLHAWWRRYIPEDVASLASWLTSSTQDWETWDSRMSWTGQWMGQSRVASLDTAPPQAVLGSTTAPGHCWPMDGSSGKVTIELAKPVSISAITLDHVSAMVVLDPENDRTSAPKEFQVVGYPPCSNCPGGLEFDVSRPVPILSSVTYDIEGPASQTFWVAKKEQEDDENSDTEVAQGSCSATAATCGAPGSDTSTIRAITVSISNNWGWEDYTCLYRVRVHGS